MFRSISATRGVAKNLLRQSRARSESPAPRALSTQQQKKPVITQPESDMIGGYHFPYDPPNSIVQNSPFETIQMRNITIDKYVWSNINKWPNHIAAVCGVTGRGYTYADMRDRCAAFAIQLQTKFGLEKGDVVGLSLPNAPEFPIAALGAIEGGLIVTTINPIYNPEEVSRQLIQSNAKLLIGAIENYAILAEAVKLTQKPIKIICVRLDANERLPAGAIDFTELMNPKGVDFSLLKDRNAAAEDITVLPFSSGTTGLSKGVQLTHNNLVSNCDMMQVEVDGSPMIYPTTPEHQEIVPCILPFFHIYGWTVLLLSKLHVGCKLVTLPRFHPEHFLNCLEQHKANILQLVPPVIIFLGHSDKVTKKHTDSVRAVFSAAAPMGAPDAERLIKRAPQIKFCQGYGLTETSPCVLLGLLGDNKYDAVGFPTSTTQAKVCAIGDDKYIGLGPNQSGEILVRGPQIMKGYLNNEAATVETVVTNGWLRTGDIGYYDAEDGQFRITDRLKELIKVKGFQVPPAELEEVLRTHPDIIDAGVVGVPHRISGEVPRAFVVAKPGSTVSEKEIQDYVASKVSAYKHLAGGVTFLPAIPKNATGKIMRRILKEEHCEA